MHKFTVFTVILSVVVIVVVADMVVNNYLPGMSGSDVVAELTAGKFTLPDSIDVSKATETNVLGATEIDSETTPEVTATNRLGFDLENESTTTPETMTIPVNN